MSVGMSIDADVVRERWPWLILATAAVLLATDKPVLLAPAMNPRIAATMRAWSWVPHSSRMECMESIGLPTSIARTPRRAVRVNVSRSPTRTPTTESAAPRAESIAISTWAKASVW